jgi:hypothetical protein
MRARSRGSNYLQAEKNEPNDNTEIQNSKMLTGEAVSLTPSAALRIIQVTQNF